MNQKIIFPLLVLTIFFSLGLPQAFADDMTVIQSCNNYHITISVHDDENHPLNNASVHIYSDLSNSRFTETLKTDSDGNVSFDYSKDTKSAKVSKGGFNDLQIILACDDPFRSQSMNIFSTSDSHIGIFNDDKSGITVIDFGTLFGIAGSGSMPDKIDVSVNTERTFSISHESISPKSAHGDWQISQSFFTKFSDKGVWTLNLITDEKITHTFQFEVRQVSNIPVDNQHESSRLDVENMDLKEKITGLEEKIVKLEDKNSQLEFKIDDLQNIINEQIKVMMELFQEIKIK